MKKLAITIGIVLVVAGTTYVILQDIGSHRIAVKIEGGALRHLHKTWIDLGKPTQLDPSSYLTSSATKYLWDTNTYYESGKLVESLIVANSTRFGKPGSLIVAKDGKIYWVDEGRNLLLIHSFDMADP